MLSTTRLDVNATITHGGRTAEDAPNELITHYMNILGGQKLNWTSHHRFEKLLGTGGQGVVYLSERRGADNFTLPVAVKIFSPERYLNATSYDEAMNRIAHVASLVARIQQDNLLDVQNFVDRNRIRMMVMEWVDGYDLQRLLRPSMLGRVQQNVSSKRWEYINRVVVTAGPRQSQFKPGVAVAIVRDCLAALSALHRDNVIHGDIKPSNIMLKCTGTAKIVDIGSAFEVDDPPAIRTCTPAYAAPEVLEGDIASPRSDLASLGYVLIEMLAGQALFPGAKTRKELLESKRSLPSRLTQLLPEQVTVNELLMNFCRGLIAPDPNRRFPSAEAADLVENGAAGFHRQLIISNMASEYDSEIRKWLEEVKELDELEDTETQ